MNAKQPAGRAAVVLDSRCVIAKSCRQLIEDRVVTVLDIVVIEAVKGCLPDQPGRSLQGQPSGVKSSCPALGIAVDNMAATRNIRLCKTHDLPPPFPAAGYLFDRGHQEKIVLGEVRRFKQPVERVIKFP